MINVMETTNENNNTHCNIYPSPSSLEACAVCNDRFRMERKYTGTTDGNGEGQSNQDAERGTVIHEACAYVLQIYLHNRDKIGDFDNQMAVYDAVFLEVNLIKGWNDEYWSTVHKAVKAVLTEIARMENDSTVNVYTEKLVNLDSVLKGFYGTADVVAINDKELLVADYKTGYRLVKAKNNRQLACYAYGFLNDNIEDVTFLISQPTKNNYDRCSMKVDDLKKLMQENVRLIETVSDTTKEHKRKRSDMSCTYCKALLYCKEPFRILGEKATVLATVKDGFKTADELGELYVTCREIGNLAESIRNSALNAIEHGESKMFYVKHNKDKEYIENDDIGKLLTEIADAGLFQQFIDDGILKNDVKIDLNKAKGIDAYDDIFGKYVKTKAGNKIITERNGR